MLSTVEIEFKSFKRWELLFRKHLGYFPLQWDQRQGDISEVLGYITTFISLQKKKREHLMFKNV